MTNKETNVKNIDKVEAVKRAKGYYGEDTLETRIAYSSFLDGCEWKEQQMIEKACEWLKDNINDYLVWYDFREECRVNKDELLCNFKKAMKGGEE